MVCIRGFKKKIGGEIINTSAHGGGGLLRAVRGSEGEPGHLRRGRTVYCLEPLGYFFSFFPTMGWCITYKKKPHSLLKFKK